MHLEMCLKLKQRYLHLITRHLYDELSQSHDLIPFVFQTPQFKLQGDSFYFFA